MYYYPINLSVSGKSVVVIGGGAVAVRKCSALLDAGAEVKVVAPALDDSLIDLRDSGQLVHLARGYQRGDLAGAFLVLAVTDNAAVNKAVAEEARASGILADIADDPALCDFTLPAVVRQGDLLIAVSTGGKSPALARQIRKELEARYGPEYAMALTLLGAIREKLLTEEGTSPYNKKLFNTLVGHDLPGLFRNRSFTKIDHLLTTLFGPEYALSELRAGEKDPA